MLRIMFTSTAVWGLKLHNISEDMAMYVIQKGKHEVLGKRAPDEHARVGLLALSYLVQ